MRISQRGRITIPKPLRDRFGLNHDAEVERTSDAPSWREPFDIDALLNDPNPKIFDPDKVVTVSEPFDVDEFIRVIHEGRDAGYEVRPS